MKATRVATPGSRWGDIALRTTSAAVLAPLVLACIWLGGWAWWSLAAMGAAALAFEWLAVCRAGRVGLAFVLTGLAFLALSLGCLLWLRADTLHGRADLLLLLAIVWSCDIGAYLAGRAIGGPRLAPAISPGKTWSGTAGGLVAAIAAGMVAAIVWPPASPLHGAALGLLLGLASQCGDLAESWVKRRCGVKDSGRLIPGHGGVLDRLDGVLLAAPAMALIAGMAGRGHGLWN